MFHSAFGNSLKKFCFGKIVQRKRDWSKYFTMSHEIQLCWALICFKRRSIALCWKYFKIPSAFGSNSLTKFCFNKIVQGKGWLLKILHHESRHSTMSRFNKFQVRIYSALCKLFHSVFGNSPKKFRAIRVQIKQLGTSSINLNATSWSTSINEWIVKIIEGLLGKMLLMIHFGAVTYKSCHHQLLAGYSMLRKFKYLQRIIKLIEHI